MVFLSLGRGGTEIGCCWDENGDPIRRIWEIEHSTQNIYPEGVGLYRGDEVETWAGFGFHYQPEERERPPVSKPPLIYHWWSLIAPLWALVVGLALLPAIRFRWLVQRKARPGHCYKCGHNLTGNVSGVCPECGKPIPK
jgi:hypothetical protein